MTLSGALAAVLSRSTRGMDEARHAPQFVAWLVVNALASAAAIAATSRSMGRPPRRSRD